MHNFRHFDFGVNLSELMTNYTHKKNIPIIQINIWWSQRKHI